MATIGTFKKNENGTLQGSINTLVVSVANVLFVPVEKTSEDGPSMRIMAGRAEIGAAWERETKEGGNKYLSVKLDDPSLAEPIYARLVQTDKSEDLQLIYSRN